MGEQDVTIAAPNARAGRGRAGRHAYDHAQHEPARRRLRWLLERIGWRWLAKIDSVEGLEDFPREGPAIVMINHIAFLDPVVVMGNLPRNVVPMAKAEVYRLPIWGWFTRQWSVIPVQRMGLDRQALEQALAVLRAGEVVLVAPEGTRHEALRDPHDGLAYLALKTGVPVVPVVVEGTQGYPLPWFLWGGRPGTTIKIGRPFRFKPVAGRPPRDYLKKMTDEAMYMLAEMLPEHRRGEYADLSKATRETWEWVS